MQRTKTFLYGKTWCAAVAAAAYTTAILTESRMWGELRAYHLSRRFDACLVASLLKQVSKTHDKR